MGVPASVLPKLAGVSHMARSVLLVAYAMADEDGEVRRLETAGKVVHGQDRSEVRRSIAELVRADLAKYEQHHLGAVLTLLEWGG